MMTTIMGETDIIGSPTMPLRLAQLHSFLERIRMPSKTAGAATLSEVSAVGWNLRFFLTPLAGETAGETIPRRRTSTNPPTMITVIFAWG